MTAEIAVLNKTAVALAADSAVTISAGSREEKIYDSAEKLFELSNKNPIAIMLYNGMSFMQIPIATLIHQFKGSCDKFDTVQDAADEFLKYLNNAGKNSPEAVKNSSLTLILMPVIDAISDKIQGVLSDIASNMENVADVETFQTLFQEKAVEEISTIQRALEKRDDAEFITGKVLQITKARKMQILEIIRSSISFKNDSIIEAAYEVCRLALTKSYLSNSRTGIIFAGFGTNEMFPTLIAYEIDGMFFERTKIVKNNKIDIARNGTRARVLPFAQKEMVERFLYGIDNVIEKNIVKFCASTVPAVREELMSHLEMSDRDRSDLEARAKEAERAFVNELRDDAFKGIRSQSRDEIEEMVEFMPKAELASMAEALVNLTSIKRRVSKGMETVRGPIDVAIISQSEGFIWVKRKHYFSSDLNQRYLNKIATDNGGDSKNG